MPCLLLTESGLVKTVRFSRPAYIGDPINAVRIFNQKEVDELVLLDIKATPAGRRPDFETVRGIVEEAFIPVAYGGGVGSVEDADRLFSIGVEKVIVNSAAVMRQGLVEEMARRFGSQSVAVSLDARRRLLGGWEVRTHGGRRRTGSDPARLAAQLADAGAGEILIGSIDRDGTREGYDLALVAKVAAAVAVPVVAIGGAGMLDHFCEAVASGASAVAAGSLFVQHGPWRGVLITYPERDALEALLP